VAWRGDRAADGRGATGGSVVCGEGKRPGKECSLFYFVIKCTHRRWPGGAVVWRIEKRATCKLRRRLAAGDAAGSATYCRVSHNFVLCTVDAY